MPADAPEALRRILSKEENIGWILTNGRLTDMAQDRRASSF